MSNAQWASLNLELPLVIDGIYTGLRPIVALLRTTLDVVKSALLLAQAFMHAYLDPIAALIDAIITEVRNLLRDLETIGIYITGDWLLTDGNAIQLYEGFEGFKKRMVTALTDTKDPTRPDVSTDTLVTAVFIVVNNPYDATLDRAEDYLTKTLENLLRLTQFFNVETTTSNPLAAPTLAQITFSPNEIRGPWTTTPTPETTYVRVAVEPLRFVDTFVGDGYGKYIISQTEGAFPQTLPPLLNSTTLKPILSKGQPVTWFGDNKPDSTTQPLVTYSVHQGYMGYVTFKRQDLSAQTITIGVQHTTWSQSDSLQTATALNYDQTELQTAPPWTPQSGLSSNPTLRTLHFPVSITTGEMDNAKLAALNALLVETLTTTSSKKTSKPVAPVDYESNYIVAIKRKEADILLADATAECIKTISGPATQNLRTTNAYSLSNGIVGKPGLQNTLEKDVRDLHLKEGSIEFPNALTQDVSEANLTLLLLRKGLSSSTSTLQSKGRWSRVTLGDIMPFLHPFLHLLDDFLAGLQDTTKSIVDILDTAIESLIAKVEQLDALLLTLDSLLADIEALKFALPSASLSVLTTVAAGVTGTVEALISALNPPKDEPLYLNDNTGVMEGSHYLSARVPMGGMCILASTIPTFLLELIGASPSTLSASVAALSEDTTISSDILQEGVDLL